MSMPDYQKTQASALKNFKVADHMLSVTFPIVRDPKLLLAILDNIFLSLINSLSALLYYERQFKKIPPFQDNFDSKYNMFVLRCMQVHEFKNEDAQFIRDIKNIIVEHRKSPIEFVRKDKFVICSENYQIKSLSLGDIKSYLSKAKIFIDKINSIISQK